MYFFESARGLTAVFLVIWSDVLYRLAYIEVISITMCYLICKDLVCVSVAYDCCNVSWLYMA